MTELYEEETAVIDGETVEEEIVIENDSEDVFELNSARRRLEAKLEERRLRDEIEDFLDE